MGKFLIKFPTAFAVAVLLLFSANEAEADVQMMQFAGSVNIGASVDTTYQYVVGKDREAENSDGQNPQERGLYPEHNDFSIDAFTLSLEKEADGAGVGLEKVGFRTDILFGEQAERLGFGFNSDGDGSVSPYQAYINIAPTESLSIKAGQFTTLAGWELIEAKNNTNISRSLLFYRIPFAHSGARFSYNTGPIDLTFGISNDWDAVDEVNDGKTFEFQAAYSHSSEAGFINDLWLGATAYVGKSQFFENKGSVFNDDDQVMVYTVDDMGAHSATADGTLDRKSDTNNTRTLVTLVGSVTSGKFTFVGDTEFTWVSDGIAERVYTSFMGNDPRTSEVEDNDNPYSLLTGVKYETFFRWGVGGYLNYQATEDMAFSLRTEYVDDSDTANGVKLFEVTPTVAWKPFGSSETGTLETRFEYRWDNADKKYFVDDKGMEKKNQHALLLQLLYWI